MLPSPPPHESPVKAVEESVEPGSIARFRTLAARLFALDRASFGAAADADEKERAKRRALSPAPPGRRKG